METVIPCEKRLNDSPRWALLKGSLHFEKDGAAFNTMRKLARRFEERGEPDSPCSPN